MRALSIIELERLIGIMRQMQQHASNANWHELARLDNERRALLKYDAATNSSHADSQTAQTDLSKLDSERHVDSLHTKTKDSLHESLVQEIQVLDRQIIDEAAAAREKLLVLNRGLNAQVKAKNLYAQTSSFT